ncbi:MAG: hypothetical protein QXD03_03655 [Candidatus Anstonellales archaeon]
MEIRFKDDFEPLNEAIRFSISMNIDNLENQIRLFGGDFLKSDTSKKEYGDLVKKIVEDTARSLSRKYISHLTKNYYSKEGLTFYIIKNVMSYLNDYISAKLENK